MDIVIPYEDIFFFWHDIDEENDSEKHRAE